MSVQCRLALFRELFPPVADFPVAKAMPLMNFKKLVPKVYEAVVCEFYNQSSQRGKTRRDRPRLFDFVEDSLIREYGLKSLSRKTLLQMVATVHIHHAKDPRVRMFAELASIIPSAKTSIETCGGCAEDFFFWFMSKVYSENLTKLAENMSSVRFLCNLLVSTISVRAEQKRSKTLVHCRSGRTSCCSRSQSGM